MRREKHPPYLLVGVALLVLTALSFFMSEGLGSKAMSVALVLCVASIKATLVAMFFMHAKFEGAWLYVLTVPAVVLGTILVCALLPDVARFGL